MVQDQPLLCSGLTRQLSWTAEGTESGNAKVPVGNVGKPEGNLVKGDASNVFVMLVTLLSALQILENAVDVARSM